MMRPFTLLRPNPITIAGERNDAKFIKQTLLADVNVPFNFSMDLKSGHLFFSINADDFSDQSFHSVVLNLDSGQSHVIPGIRNGYASAVDASSGRVYLGGSDGIYQYNFTTSDVDKPAVLRGFDVLDMFYKDHLYFVDTASQNLNIVKNCSYQLCPELRDQRVQYFVLDNDGDVLYVNPDGLNIFRKKLNVRNLVEGSDLNYRCAATDVRGIPYIMAHDGIYSIDKENKRLVKILSLDNCYGLSFDRDNNIIYSEKRSVIKLIPC